ncbi:MAG TPA: hypothetical protein DDZ67_08725 [Xanthomonadaceae bacterium]|nr:hypothetical protein [Xanthomonadaceae bacterium]
MLLLGSALLAVGCLGAASGRVTDTGADYGVSETEQENATPPEASRRPARRLRTSLSVPYFSFAQVLRPRS